MGLLYAENNKIYCNDYMEIYVPMDYFSEDNIAVNTGITIDTFGVCFTRSFVGGQEGPIRMMKVPVLVSYNIHEFKYETIHVHNRAIEVMTLEYPKGSCVMHQTVTRGRTVASDFLTTLMSGHLPKVINYRALLDLWWENLTIAGVSYKVPSKMYEIILATVYRHPNDPKKRYGQLYGKQANPSGYDYTTGNVRSIVKNLSTFSGMIFEDMSTMITNGIHNSLTGVEEPVSPLEKIIHY